MITSRRTFITGLSALIAAPAIVRASSLMPVKALPRELTQDEINVLVNARLQECYEAMRQNMTRILYGYPAKPQMQLVGYGVGFSNVEWQPQPEPIWEYELK